MHLIYFLLYSSRFLSPTFPLFSISPTPFPLLSTLTHTLLFSLSPLFPSSYSQSSPQLSPLPPPLLLLLLHPSHPFFYLFTHPSSLLLSFIPFPLHSSLTPLLPISSLPTRSCPLYLSTLSCE